MAPAVLELSRSAILPEPDRQTAREASVAVGRLAGRGPIRVEAFPVSHDMPRQTFVLPAAAVRLLTDMLVHLSAGAPVVVFPEHAELTTQQAADFLNVSRPWLVRLIEQGKLPHHKVGTHRRIFFTDLRAYKEDMNAARRRALDGLVTEAQAMGEYE